MSQTSFDEDELFDEASEEMKKDIEASLENAREKLPDGDDFIDVEGKNLVGILNRFKADVEPEGLTEDIREAKKNLELAKRADALGDEYVDEKESEIEEMSEAQDSLREVEEIATELTNAVAEVKGKLG